MPECSHIQIQFHFFLLIRLPCLPRLSRLNCPGPRLAFLVMLFHPAPNVPCRLRIFPACLFSFPLASIFLSQRSAGSSTTSPPPCLDDMRTNHRLFAYGLSTFACLLPRASGRPRPDPSSPVSSRIFTFPRPIALVLPSAWPLVSCCTTFLSFVSRGTSLFLSDNQIVFNNIRQCFNICG